MTEDQETDLRNALLRRAEAVAARLDLPMGIVGVLFLLIVLAQVLATDPVLLAVLGVAGWLFWAVFVAEFLLRTFIAGFQGSFWKRNWWQVIFLLVPFLRFFRALQALRIWRVAHCPVSAGPFPPVSAVRVRPGGCCQAGSGGWPPSPRSLSWFPASFFISGSYSRRGPRPGNQETEAERLRAPSPSSRPGRHGGAAVTAYIADDHHRRGLRLAD